MNIPTTPASVASRLTDEEILNLKERTMESKIYTAQQLANWLKELVVLRSKLKVAEDALEKITTGCFSHKDGDKPIVQVIIDIASNALFAIREEGGAK